MHRIAVNFLFFSDLHKIAEIHNTDTVTDIFHNTQVMCNKNIGQIQVMLQFI